MSWYYKLQTHICHCYLLGQHKLVNDYQSEVEASSNLVQTRERFCENPAPAYGGIETHCCLFLLILRWVKCFGISGDSCRQFVNKINREEVQSEYDGEMFSVELSLVYLILTSTNQFSHCTQW